MESGKIIVVANQKGGVAKTSTVRNLSYALAEMGKKVLVVDFDPQYNLTTSFGVLPTQTPCNTGTLITNLLLDESLPDTNEFIQKIGSVDLIPSSRSLTVAEANLLMTPDSNDYLAALLNPLRLSYDYIIVDTNPSLGSLTINALTAADEVIIPIDPELFALTGLQALVDTIKKIKRKLNPSIEIGGILFTKCNKRTNLYRRTYGQVTKAFQSLPIFNCQIPYTVKVGDANSYGMSVMELEQANPASLAYWVWHSTGKNTGYWVDDGWYDYFRDNYSASMTATTRIEPDEKVPTASGDLMKSGYGVTNTVTATVSTSAPLSHYTYGQTAVSYFPEFGYGTYWRLLERLTSGTTARFQFAKNIYSTYNQRVHFSPVWFPDGSYTVNTHVMDIWTPAGMLAMNLTDDVTISGSLYDDWHIAPGNP